MWIDNRVQSSCPLWGNAYIQWQCHAHFAWWDIWDVWICISWRRTMVGQLDWHCGSVDVAPYFQYWRRWGVGEMYVEEVSWCSWWKVKVNILMCVQVFKCLVLGNKYSLAFILNFLPTPVGETYKQTNKQHQPLDLNGVLANELVACWRSDKSRWVILRHEWQG